MSEKVESKPVGADASNDKIIAAIATIPVVGLIMFYAMKDASPVVKHYAKQSNAILAIHVASVVVSVVLGAISFGLLSCVGVLVSLLGVAAQVLLVVKIFNGDDKYLLPVMGEYFDKILK
jgi:uncharacterized membrane protein